MSAGGGLAVAAVAGDDAADEGRCNSAHGATTSRPGSGGGDGDGAAARHSKSILRNCVGGVGGGVGDDGEEWCLPQRTGARRYLPLLQDLMWLYERAQVRIDDASGCARRRYDHARRLCDIESKSRRDRALCRLVRHYALHLSLLHIMSVALAYTWRTLLYCVRAVADAPLPVPDDGRYGVDAAAVAAAAAPPVAVCVHYAQNVYRRLHGACRDAADTMRRSVAQFDEWLRAMDAQPSVRALDAEWRVQVAQWTRRSVLDAMQQCRADVRASWQLLWDFCDCARVDARADNADEAARALCALTGTARSDDAVELVSRRTVASTGARICVPLPLLSEAHRDGSGDTKTLTPEMMRLEAALRAVGA